MSDIGSDRSVPSRRTVFAGAAATLCVLGCGFGTGDAASRSAASSTTPPTVAASDAPVDDVWQIVGLGDSFTATQNTMGQTYLDLFAEALQESTGRTVTVDDLSDDANTSGRVAERLRSDATTRAAVAAADIVLISVGGNDSDPFGVYPDGTCSPSQPSPECLTAYSPEFAANYESILSDVDSLRVGRPTALRVTSADNPFVGWSEAPSPTFGVEFYAQVAEAQTNAACYIATAHGGLCVDYLHIFGGSNGTDDPARFLGPDHAHPADLGIQTIADELIRLGVPELE